jgi:hypothetical protein
MGRLVSIEMHFMRWIMGYTLSDHKRNEVMTTVNFIRNRIFEVIQKKLERTH